LNDCGEYLGIEELQNALGYLVGTKLIKEALPQPMISAEMFASDVLGFEEYEEEVEEQEAENVGGSKIGERSVARGRTNEVIPEEPGY